MTTPRLQKEFDRLHETPGRILTDRETDALFDGEPATGERNDVPLWLIVLISTSLAAGWASIPFIVDWAGGHFGG